MNFFLFAGILILGTAQIPNVHGLRNRNFKLEKKPAKKQVVYPGTPGLVNPSPDPSCVPDSDDRGCCGCGKKKTSSYYPNPLGKVPTGYPYGNITPTGPIEMSPPAVPIEMSPPAVPIGVSPPTGPIEMSPPAVPIGMSPLVVPIGMSPPAASQGVGPVGFAQEFRTTGGNGGEVVQISTLNDLVQYISDSIPRVLVINNDIRASCLTKVQMGSFKSIVGLNQNAKLYNIYLRATPSSQNIIFQNLIFEHSPNNKGNDDIQLYLNYGRAYWIDHCAFVGHVWSLNDGSKDKLLYVGEEATGVTISYCYFGNHNFGLIFGHPEDDVNVPAEDDTCLTMFNNHFENMGDRAPGLFRFGHYHVFNNFINNYGLGFTVATGGKVISEYNYFGASPRHNSMLNDFGTGKFMDTGSVPPIMNIKSPPDDWFPSYHYNLNASAPVPADTVNKNVYKRIIPPRGASTLVPPLMQFMPPPNFPALP